MDGLEFLRQGLGAKRKKAFLMCRENYLQSVAETSESGRQGPPSSEPGCLAGIEGLVLRRKIMGVK